MVRIRLRRVGSTHQPSYRIVIADAESPRDGDFIEVIGYYNPRTDPPTVEVKDERALYWLSVGAQPSEAVERMLRKRGVYDRLAEQRAEAKARRQQPQIPVEAPEAVLSDTVATETEPLPEVEIAGARAY